MATPKIYTADATSGAIDAKFPSDISGEDADFAFYLENVTIHFDSAPSTVGQGDIIITLDAAAGNSYDVVLASIDPAAHPSIQDFVYTPDSPLLCVTGDEIKAYYANSDNRTWGLRMVGRSV